MAELTVETAFLTDVGMMRKPNQDFVESCEPTDPDELAHSGRLYVVADGLGSEAAGAAASGYVARKIVYEYYQSTAADLGTRLRDAIDAANIDILAHMEQRPELGRMSTTIVVAAIRGDELVVANAGNSRAYLIRDGEIHRITRDHTLVENLMEGGFITPEEAEHHSMRNVLLRSLGMDTDIYLDIFEGQIQPCDRVLLCSDGLTRYVSDVEILRMASHAQLDHAVQLLVDVANMRGGEDNISVVLLYATEAEPTFTAEQRPRWSMRQSLRSPEFDDFMP